MGLLIALFSLVWFYENGYLRFVRFMASIATVTIFGPVVLPEALKLVQNLGSNYSHSGSSRFNDVFKDRKSLTRGA